MGRWRGASGWLAVMLTCVRPSTAQAGHCDYCNDPLPNEVQIERDAPW